MTMPHRDNDIPHSLKHKYTTMTTSLQQRCILIRHVLPVRVQQGLKLRGHHIHPRFQLRQTVADVVHQQPVQRFREVRRAVARRQGRVFALQERCLVLDGLLDVLLVDDVLLGPVDNTDDA